MHLKNQIVQKIYKKSKSRSGKTVYNKRLIGVLVAGLDPTEPNKVNIGYSLCHKKDKWDHPTVNGIQIKAPGFGQKLATRRAVEYGGMFHVEVPPSIHKEIFKFTERCRRYYKGAVLPMWVVVPEIQNPCREVKIPHDGVREIPVIPVETDDGIVMCRCNDEGC
jgi:hypothetical protein